MKVALIQCPVWGIFEPPVGLAQISSYLKQKGNEIKIWDLNIELYSTRSPKYQNIWAMEQSIFWTDDDSVSRFFIENLQIEKFIDEIFKFEPQIIGFSVNMASRISTLQLLKKLKEKNKNFLSVLGGPLFKNREWIESLLRNENVDIIIPGECEVALSELIEKIENNGRVEYCKGIYFKKNNNIVYTGRRELMKKLDNLPFMDLYIFPLEKYNPPPHQGKHISLMTSRGCLWSCVFCGAKPYWSGYRTMSGKRIFEEIKYHIKKQPDIQYIEFLDLLFNGNMKTIQEFCDLMIKNGIDIPWHANVTVRPEMDGAVLTKIRKAGCDHLTYGIESGSQKVLNLMRKRFEISVAERVLRATHQVGIKVTCNFMFGFPGETEVDFNETLDFIKRNASNIDIVYPSRSFCVLEDNSYLIEHTEEFGIKPDYTHPLYWESKDGENIYPERRRRCEVFSRFADTLGISVGLGLQTSIELDKWFNLGNYYESMGKIDEAIECYKNYIRLDPENVEILNRIKNIQSKILKSDT